MSAAGMHELPSNDFSFDDHMLDMLITVGAVPERYLAISDPLQRYFVLGGVIANPTLPPLPRASWFDTRYRYVVPQLHARQRFTLNAQKILEEVREARELGLPTRPVIVGPITFLMLSHFLTPGGHALDLLPRLLPVYEELFALLAAERVEWLQLDEPYLTLALDTYIQERYQRAFVHLSACPTRPKILLTTYFGALGANKELAIQSGCEGLHLDLVSAPKQREEITVQLANHQVLSLGVVDGRNIWRTDLEAAHARVRCSVQRLGSERVWVAPSCSLLHVPFDLGQERNLDTELRSWMAFAVQKLEEVSLLARTADDGKVSGTLVDEVRRVLPAQRNSPRIKHNALRRRQEELNTKMPTRVPAFAAREAAQQSYAPLPPLPLGLLSPLPGAALESLQIQVEAGLDVLLLGAATDAERLETCAARLEGIALTENGWIQVAGLQCVRPPILYGDVRHQGALTDLPAEPLAQIANKAIAVVLPGPFNLLHACFVRRDLETRIIGQQLALALYDELTYLQAAGVPLIELDERAAAVAQPLPEATVNYGSWTTTALRLVAAAATARTRVLLRLRSAPLLECLRVLMEADIDVFVLEPSGDLQLLQELVSAAGLRNFAVTVNPPDVDAADLQAHLSKLLQTPATQRLWLTVDGSHHNDANRASLSTTHVRALAHLVQQLRTQLSSA
jgi:5-methyltetrahydropteroyltriglutamate--homocysteine methyltransferase